MARPRTRGVVVAREAMTVHVGTRPVEYHVAQVKDRKTDEVKPVPLTEFEPKDPGSEGVAYTFKQYQKAARSHPAVMQSPHLFMDIEELNDEEQELVTS